MAIPTQKPRLKETFIPVDERTIELPLTWLARILLNPLQRVDLNETNPLLADYIEVSHDLADEIKSVDPTSLLLHVQYTDVITEATLAMPRVWLSAHWKISYERHLVRKKESQKLRALHARRDQLIHEMTLKLATDTGLDLDSSRTLINNWVSKRAVAACRETTGLDITPILDITIL